MGAGGFGSRQKVQLVRVEGSQFYFLKQKFVLVARSTGPRQTFFAARNFHV